MRCWCLLLVAAGCLGVSELEGRIGDRLVGRRWRLGSWKVEESLREKGGGERTYGALRNVGDVLGSNAEGEEGEEDEGVKIQDHSGWMRKESRLFSGADYSWGK